MAADNSFDIVSKVDIQEVKNAIDQATKEVNARFDLKNSKSTIALEGQDVVQLASQDEYTLKAVIEILAQKFVKRNVSLKNLEYEKLEPASNSSVRQKDQAEAGHRIRARKEDRRHHQGLKTKSAGQHPGRHRPRHQQRPRHAATDYGAITRPGTGD